MEGCQALWTKYCALQALRLERAERGEVAATPRLRELAARFPGALRELDQLAMVEIDSRIGQLDRAMRGLAPVPDWVRPQLAYHGWMRLALAVRRLPRDAPLEWVRSQLSGAYQAGPGEPDGADLGVALLQAIRSPPGGRLNVWVFGRVAECLGSDPAAVEATLFGPRACGAPPGTP